MHAYKPPFVSALSLLTALPLFFAVACDDETPDVAAGTDAGATPDASRPGDGPTPDAGARPDTGSNADTGAAETWSAKVIASFDAKSFQLPEGLAIKGGFAYAGFAPLGKIAKVDLKTGASTEFGSVPTPVAGKGFMTGLAFGPDDALYAALVSFDPSVQPGIYRLPSAGGAATLFAKDAGLVFPNGLYFDTEGSLFVTESASASILKIGKTGVVSTWFKDEATLKGDQASCGGSGNGFDIGGNGLAFRDGAFYAANTDRGLLAKIAVNADGTAGAKTVLVDDCALAGADGLVPGEDGALVVAVNRQNKIVRFMPDGRLEVLASGASVDFPASLAWSGDALIATNFAYAAALTEGASPKPGLLALSKTR